MRLRWVAAIALIWGVVAGCTSDGSTGPSKSATSAPVSSVATSPAPSTSVTASPTPTIATTGPNVRPGEKPPVLAEAGKTKTSIGSDLYARYWTASLDWAYATTDSSLARTIYTAACTSCARFLTLSIDDVRQQRRHFRGGRLVVSSSTIQANDGRHGASAVVDLTVSQSRLEVVGSAEAVVERTPPSNNVVFRNWLRWDASGWRVVDWKRAVTK